MTPEGKRKQKITKWLKSMKPKGVWYCMPPSGPYGKRGIPDYLICVRGVFFAVEVKAGAGKPTPLQKQTLTDIGEAGGMPMVVNSDETQRNMEEWIVRVLLLNKEVRHVDDE